MYVCMFFCVCLEGKQFPRILNELMNSKYNGKSILVEIKDEDGGDESHHGDPVCCEVYLHSVLEDGECAAGAVVTPLGSPRAHVPRPRPTALLVGLAWKHNEIRSLSSSRTAASVGFALSRSQGCLMCRQICEFIYKPQRVIS